MLQPNEIRGQLSTFREHTSRPINVNFFAHTTSATNTIADLRWRHCLAPYYAKLGIDRDQAAQVSTRAPFDAVACEMVEEFRPEVVSFHFGLPHASLLARVIAAGAKVIASATTVKEAR